MHVNSCFGQYRSTFTIYSVAKISYLLCVIVVVMLSCMNSGTEFMVKLHEQLKYFVAKKVSTDRLWQGPRIYLSGHEVIW